MKDTVQVSMVLPRLLWQQLQGQAQNERLAQECEALAMMTFDDVGTEEEWLDLQNEALHRFENELER